MRYYAPCMHKTHLRRRHRADAGMWSLRHSHRTCARHSTGSSQIVRPFLSVLSALVPPQEVSSWMTSWISSECVRLPFDPSPISSHLFSSVDRSFRASVRSFVHPFLPSVISFSPPCTHCLSVPRFRYGSQGTLQVPSLLLRVHLQPFNPFTAFCVPTTPFCNFISETSLRLSWPISHTLTDIGNPRSRVLRFPLWTTRVRPPKFDDLLCRRCARLPCLESRSRCRMGQIEQLAWCTFGCRASGQFSPPHLSLPLRNTGSI